MNKLSQSLSQLVQEACQHPHGSRERQKKLTTIIRLVNSRLWHENTPYYEDALQETWMYFCRNICDGNSGKVYDPDKASVVTWLNNYLKWRLKDGLIRTSKEKQQIVTPSVDENNHIIDWIANLPAKENVPPILEEIEKWAMEDSQNSLRSIHVRNHPQITAQMLIIKRLPPETEWSQLAEEYGVAVGTLSSFYQRKCKPLLRKFSQSQGYI